MPRLNLDLDSLTRQRQGVLDLQARKRELDFALAAQESALAQAERNGASPNVLEPLRGQLNEARAGRRQLLEQLREQAQGVDRISGELLADLDPARMTEALDGSLPIALLPMRLETRYVREGTALRIRVYPDDLNIIEHTVGLTEKEKQIGRAHWEARFRAEDDEAERCARDLALSTGRSRCAWVLRVLTPDNADQAGQPGALPQFPVLPEIEARAKQTRALLLPDRWCAIGYAAGRREVFRVWGRRIPDELVLTPDWTNTDEPEALLQGDRAWLADFDAAVEKGMALEVTQSAVDAFVRERRGAPFRLATDTLERLIIVGLEWSKDAQQTAGELGELLAAHRDSGGLGFVPLDTPTNNTEAARSGYSPSEQRSPPPTPGENSQLPPEKDALQLLVDSLGLPAEQLAAEGIENAHLAEQRTALHLMNVLWRATFGHYLLELWNPPGEEMDHLLKTPDLYELRRYAVSYLRPAGPLPLLRVGKQPYGILPVVSKGFVPDSPGPIRLLRDSQAVVEGNIAKVLNILRPLWELASASVPLLKDGNVDKAKDILQTSPWSQAAFYRNADLLCLNSPVVFDVSGVQQPLRGQLIGQVLGALGINQDVGTLPIYNCVSFPPDPPYEPGSLAGVPWVLADPQQPTQEASSATTFKPEQNYLSSMAEALGKEAAAADRLLSGYQAGPSLLQALVACSAQMERHDSAQSFALSSKAITQVLSTAASRLVHIEPIQQNEAMFQVTSPQELAGVVIPNLTGPLSLGDYVAHRVATAPAQLQKGDALKAGALLHDSVAQLPPPLRDVTAVRLSLEYLATRTVGELNTAFKSTLDAFSHRLDAWFTARAQRRLEQLRSRQARGVYVGGFAWVENLKADQRPDSEGFLLAPSQGQAAAAAILRSGFMANHEQGAFNIQLDSRRARRAQDLLQGLTRDQPLAALYGYRLERGLRDTQLGKLIWPLRLAYPWRPTGGDVSTDSHEAIGARDVVDGVALLDAWETSPAAVWTHVRSVTVNGGQPFNTLNPGEQSLFEQVVRDAVDLADSVSDLLLAEGTYQIAQGNFERASAALAIVDKQTLPFEMQVARTPRGGASYAQRVALLCPAPAANNWPEDRKSRTEPALNAWVAHMLGDPARFVFSAVVQRGKSDDGQPILDADPVTVALSELGYSPLAAVLSATAVTRGALTGPAETGFRGRLAAALAGKVADPQTVTGLDIQQGGDDSLGLAHFEALATTLRTLLSQARPLTRKDLVVPEDAIESTLPDEGEYPGVDAAEIRSRADTLIADFVNLKDALSSTATGDDLLVSLAALEDFLPRASWPPQAVAIDAPGADPAEREARADQAREVVAAQLQAKWDDLNAPIPLLDQQPAPTPAQQVQKAMDQITRLLGRDFPVLPRFALGPYTNEFNASLGDQEALTLENPWRVAEWLPQLARVREGVDRFTAALSAHETLVAVSAADDFKVVQYPHRPGHAWAALPEAWREEEGTPLDQRRVPEELHAYLEQQEGAPYKDIQRVAPKLALALHAPGGLPPLAPETTLAGMMCDEWPEFIPDPFQTAAISFHYDAPGARPPQSILLAVPPRADQTNWTFDEVLDVLHEAWDLARLRAVRPRDLGSGLGLILPGNYLPHDYTGDLPGVRALELAARAARQKLTMSAQAVIPLGKF